MHAPEYIEIERSMKLNEIVRNCLRVLEIYNDKEISMTKVCYITLYSDLYKKNHKILYENFQGASCVLLISFPFLRMYYFPINLLRLFHVMLCKNYYEKD